MYHSCGICRTVPVRAADLEDSVLVNELTGGQEADSER